MFYKNIGIITTYIIIALGLLYICSEVGSKAYFALSFYGVLLLLYLIIKKVIYYSYNIEEYNVHNYTVSAIMIIENENLKTLVLAIKSLLNQDYPLKELFIIDTASKNLNIYRLVTKIKKQIELFEESKIKGEIDLGDLKFFPDIIIRRIDRNIEKKEAEAWGFRRCTGDIVLTCRSKDLIGKEDVKELVNVFSKSNVPAITGKVNIVSKEKYKLINWLFTSNEDSISLNIKIQSHTSNIFCCDSVLRCYRREVILNNITNYVSNKFIKKNGNCKSNVTFWNLCETILTSTFFICFLLLMCHSFFYTNLLLINYYIGDVLISLNSKGKSKFIKEPVEFLLSPIYSLLYYLSAIPFRIYIFFI